MQAWAGKRDLGTRLQRTTGPSPKRELRSASAFGRRSLHVLLDRAEARALDFGARGGKKLETVPEAIVDEVLAKLPPIFE